MFVYVINKHGKPLMPTNPRKARLLLKQGRARIVKRTPFTIRLLYGSSGYTQPISLGVDAGSKTIGLSATTEKEVLFEAEATPRNDIVGLLATRRQFRRSRRNRKTRYRKARFLNRKKKEGWLAPSVENKIKTHLKAVALIHAILPIAKTVVEVAQFDIQKIKNPNIQNKEYQQGSQLGFGNVREYVLWRDGHKCQGRKGCNNSILNVHHIESRKTGGDAPNNLITLCEDCHSNHHKGTLTLNIKRGQPFRDTAFMGIMRWALYDKLKALYKNVCLTYGYLTKHTRIQSGLEKSHLVDARCISGNPLAASTSIAHYLKQVRGQNRQLHKANPKKGKRQANKAPRYVHGFQLFDRVLFDGKECFVFGRRSSGYFDLRKLGGVKVSASASVKKLRLLEMANTLLIERGDAASSPRLKAGVSAAGSG